jgi:hemerythrin
MPLMKWDAEYSVRVQEFDGHHQQLFKMVNDLNDAMQARKGKEVLGQVLLGWPPIPTNILPPKKKR